MYVSEGELKEFIIDSGLISRKDVEEAVEDAEQRGQSLGDVLVSRGLLTEDALRRMQAYVLGIPFVSLKEQKISAEVLGHIAEPIARAHNIVAYKKNDGELEVAVLDIKDLSAIDSLNKETDLKVRVRLTDTESMKLALLQYQNALKSEFGDLISAEVALIKEPRERNLSADDLRVIAEELPIVRVVDTLLRHAIAQGASDIHIEPMENQVLIRYRINGSLHDAMTLPKFAGIGIGTRIKVLANLKIDERGLPQDGRFNMETEKDRVSFRISTLPTSHGEKTVMRLLRETGEGFTLDALGFHGEGLERIHGALRQKKGLILIAGPNESGKTTTLYTMLDILNTPNVNIATVEDPVEYQMKRINQTQMNRKIGLTFPSGIRSVLRQDPDILMIGEIRDEETASLAINAVLTGRLVLAGITAPSATLAIARLIELRVDPFLIVSTLRAVVGQRLVSKLTESKNAYLTTEEDRTKIASREHFEAALGALHEEKLIKGNVDFDSLPFYKPVGTEEHPIGYKNRQGLYEVLYISPAIHELILSNHTPHTIEVQARKEGMLNLLEDGLYKAARGITSLEEIVRATN